MLDASHGLALPGDRHSAGHGPALPHKQKSPTKAGAFHQTWRRKQESNLRPITRRLTAITWHNERNLQPINSTQRQQCIWGRTAIQRHQQGNNEELPGPMKASSPRRAAPLIMLNRGLLVVQHTFFSIHMQNINDPPVIHFRRHIHRKKS